MRGRIPRALTAAEAVALVDDVERAAINVREAERQLFAVVAEARQRGLTWQEVGSGLGTSRQGAQQRHRSLRVSLEDRPLPL